MNPGFNPWRGWAGRAQLTVQVVSDFLLFVQVRQHVEGIKAEVRNTIERYVKELKDRQTLLNSELDTFQQGELRNLRYTIQDFYSILKYFIESAIYKR